MHPRCNGDVPHIPASHFHLVSLRVQVVNVTGNQDICYYNFLCAHPLGNLRCVWG